MQFNKLNGFEIAIIGMAGRFPGANNIQELWEIIKNGKETISFFSDEELLKEGIFPSVLRNRNYIKAKGIIDNIEYFDPNFFGYTPKEALVMDPQFRLFHECVWEALEDAGYNPNSYNGLIGLFAGASDNLFWRSKLMSSGVEFQYGEKFLALKDMLSTRISYNFNLRGPSTTLYNACSTSLVAVHLACRSLILGDCNIALAGAVNVNVPKKSGYMYQEGLLFSKDGHIRAFDEKATGTVFGDGAGIVVLKTLEDAINDRDNIYAIIKSTAINNDGSNKYSFTAPSEQMQAELINAAITSAEIEPESIQYIEAHGTGTALGDPIEIKGMQQGLKTDKKQFCAVGSIKPNIGHLDTVSGVAGLIKTVLALKNKLLPPNINFDTPNPNIDFENSPFYINTTLKEWKDSDQPRRAGVNSFGFGGTNVHVILEEAIQPNTTTPRKGFQIVNISTKTEQAFNNKCKDLHEFIQSNPSIDIADLAYTLNIGRKKFNYNGSFVCSDINQASEYLSNIDTIEKLYNNEKNSDVIFMFTGQGSQYINMGRELYDTFPYYQKNVDHCIKILEEKLSINLRELLYPATNISKEEFESNSKIINQTEFTQPALFIVEYALAKLFMHWGVIPKAFIGHSIGEYVAASLAGVMTLDDALQIVSTRGKLMQKMSTGSMLSISSDYKSILQILTSNVEIAAINSYSNCVVAGATGDIENFEKMLINQNIPCRRLHTSHAFHSKMMEPMLEEFERYVGNFELSEPITPFISNITGDWIQPEDARSPKYWAQHLRSTVQFSDGIVNIINKTNLPIIVEIGPGNTLCEFVKNNSKDLNKSLIINSIKRPKDNISDVSYLLKSIGRLYIQGQNINWDNYYSDEKRKRISLPTYPFERRKFWIHGDPFKIGAKLLTLSENLTKNEDLQKWFYLPQWKSSTLPFYGKLPLNTREKWLIFMDDCSIGNEFSKQLANLDQTVVLIHKGDEYQQVSKNIFNINFKSLSDYQSLFISLNEQNLLPDRILHLWNITKPTNTPINIESINEQQKNGFYSLLNIAKAINAVDINLEIKIYVISNNVQKIIDSDIIYPGKSTIIGPVKVFNQEFPNIYCKTVDIENIEDYSIIDHLLNECISTTTDHIISYRNNQRWIQSFEQLRIQHNEVPLKLKEKGTYLITGGLGSIGMIFSEYLAKTFKARLILLGRTTLPEKSTWDEWIKNHNNDSISQKLKAIIAIEKFGAEVFYIDIDVADAAKMSKLNALIMENVGKIDGVIHTAGILKKDAYVPMIEIKEQSCEEQFMPKIQGLLNLENLLKDQNPDFCIITSSFASIIAGVGFSAYASANIFMDYFVQNYNRQNKNQWLSVNWDLWHTPSVSYLYQDGKSEDVTPDIQFENISITAKEGTRVLEYLLKMNKISQMIISMSDVQTRIDRWIRFEDRNKKINENIEIEIDKNAINKNLDISNYNKTESELIKIWQQIIGYDNISINDDFFELGGDSLKAIAIVSKIKKQLNVEVSISGFYDKPSVKALAAFIEKNHREERLPAIKPIEKKDLYNLSHAQKRLWILDQIDVSEAQNNISKAFVVNDKLDADALKKAAEILINRHEILRTIFIEKDSEPQQFILNDIPNQLYYEYIDFSEYNDKDKEGKIKLAVNEVGRTKFDLKNWPLLKLRFIRSEERTSLLVLAIHHIISDAQSLNIMIAEIVTIYTALINKQQIPLPNLQIQYKDYSEWHNSILLNDNQFKQKDYWTNYLKGKLTETTLSPDFHGKTNYEFNRVTFPLGDDISAQFFKLTQENNSTLFTTFLTIIKLLLYRYSENEKKDIIVGTFALGRNQQELENQLGCYVNTLPIRTIIRKDLSFVELLFDIKKVFFETLDYQLYPYDKIIHDINYTNKRLLNIIVTAIDENTSSNSLTNLNIHNYDVDFDYRFDFDITFALVNYNHQLFVQIIYNSAIYKEETIQKVKTHFLNLTKNILSNPNTLVDKVEFKDKNEQIIDYWNNYLRNYKQQLSLPGKINSFDGFEEQNYHFEIEDNQVATLIEIAKDNKSLVHQIIYSAYAVLIGRYNAESDVVICYAELNNESSISIIPQRTHYKNEKFFNVLNNLKEELQKNKVFAFDITDNAQINDWIKLNNNILDFIYIPNTMDVNTVILNTATREINYQVTLIITLNNAKINLDYFVNSRLYNQKTITDLNNGLTEMLKIICSVPLENISMKDLDVLTVENLEDYLDQYLR